MSQSEKELFNYGFENYSSKKLVKTDTKEKNKQKDGIK